MSALSGKVPARIHLTIDRLVLDGVEPGEERTIVAALRRQLQETFAIKRDLADFGSSRPVVRGLIGEAATGSPSRIAADITTQIARSVLR